MSAAAAAVKPTRRFPPPCWTRDEALVLIEAYRERWHALHRAFLRTPDWDAVAEKVTTSCPDVTPPKTSAQCRHKMEKLRQRHRAEKQRASSFPGGNFFSSWFYFDAMETIENGSAAEPESGLNPGRGIRFKPSSVQNLVTLATSSTKHSPNFESRVSNHYSPYTNNGSNSNQEDVDEDGYLVDTPIDETSIPPSKIFKNSSIIDGVNEPGRPRKFGKVVHESEVDVNGEMWIKVPRNTNLFGGKYENERSSNPNLGKRGGVKSDGIGEVVASIKLLGDGFMKMEKMKMEMAREMEKMRMEMEMKRNVLILESQKQIVEAFVKGLIESKKQSARTTMADL